MTVYTILLAGFDAGVECTVGRIVRDHIIGCISGRWQAPAAVLPPEGPEDTGHCHSRVSGGGCYATAHSFRGPTIHERSIMRYVSV